MKLTKTALALILTSGILLTGCGEEEEMKASNIDKSDETAQEANANESGDIMEVADKSNDYDTLIYGANQAKVLNRYVNEHTNENGLNKLEFGDYELTFALVLAEDINGDTNIAILGEQVNDGEDDLASVSHTEFVTDQQEQTQFSDGEIGNIDAGIKEKIHFSIHLDYDDPEEFKVTINAPVIKAEKDDYYGGDKEPESVELEFYKE